MALQTLQQQAQRASAGPRTARAFAPCLAVRPAVRGTPLAAKPLLSKSFAPCLPSLNQSVRPSRAKLTINNAASGAPAAKEPAPFKWGANMKDLLTCIGIGAVIWFIPAPAGVTAKAWHLLAVFTATIVGIITTPLPLGAVAVLGLGAAMLTKTLTFPEAFSAFSSEIP